MSIARAVHHANRRLEVCILPGIPCEFKFEDGILILSDKSARVYIENIAAQLAGKDQHNAFSPDIPDKCIILYMVFPDSPIWPEKIGNSRADVLLARNKISIRSHVNSSCLWRHRSFIRSIDNGNIADELAFLYSVSGYKDFNYHLFNHWVQLMTEEAFWSVHGPVLQRSLKTNPNNFSLYHLVILALSESRRPFGFLGDILARYGLGGQLMTEALKEFIISAYWVFFDREGVEKAARIFDIPIFQAHKNWILAYS